MLLGIICSAHAACTQSECSSWQYCLGTCKTCSSNANCQESHSLRTVCSSTACVQCSSFSDCTGSWPSNCISGLGLCGTSVASCSGSCTSPTPNCIQYSGQNYCVACELDNDCQSWFGSTSICNTSTGKCTCSSDGDCGGSTPRCSSSLHDCVQCISDSDCSGITPKCEAISGTCVECLDSADCTSKTAAKCSSYACMVCTDDTDCNFTLEKQCLTTASPATCVQCVNDADCSGSTPKCSTSTNTCVECLASADCTSKTAAKCSSYACVACTGDTDCNFTLEKQCLTTASPATCVQCINDAGCSGSTPKCSSSNTCVECLTNADCPLKTAAKCDSNACVPCTSSTDCSLFSSEIQCLTSVSPATCVACRTDTDCGGTTPRCSTSSYTCVACVSDSDCGGTTPRCLTSSNTCVACLSNSDCTSVSESKCSTSNTCEPCSVTADCHFATSPFCLTTETPKKCVQCLADSDCSSTSLTPKCSTSTNTCVQCNSDSDCTSLIAPKCSSNTCIACSSDSDCHFSTTPKCLTSSTPAQCVQCLLDTDCASSSTTPICSTTLFGCIQCNSDADCTSLSASKCSSNLCTACVTDSDCRFDSALACSSSGVCVSTCTKYGTSCTSCTSGLYLYNSTCVSSCPLSYTANPTTNTCDPGLSQAEEATKSVSSVASSGTQIASTTMALNQIRGVAGAGMLGAAMGAQMVIMCKYINISYPSNVIIFFNNSFPVTLTIPGFTNYLASDTYYADSELNQINDNGNLELYEVSQYVFDNVGDAILTLVLCACLAGFVYMIPRLRIFTYCISPKLIKMIRKGEILGSNFVLINFFSNALQVVFYSCLNLYYPTIYTPFGYVNFVCSVGFLIAVAYYQVWTLYKLREIYYEKRALAESEADKNTEEIAEEKVEEALKENPMSKTENEHVLSKNDRKRTLRGTEQKQIEKKAENDRKENEKNKVEEKIVQPHLKALHEEYKDSTLAQQLYIPLSLFRTILFSMNLALLPNYPRAQPINAMIMHISYFLYLTITRPLKKKFDFIAQIYFELCVIGVTGCVIGIAFIATSDDFESNRDLWDNFGWPIVAFNFMLILGSLVLSIVSMIELVQEVMRIIKKIRAWRKKQKLLKQQKEAAQKALDSSPELKVQDLENERASNKMMDFTMFAASLDSTSRELIVQPALVRVESDPYFQESLITRRKIIRPRNYDRELEFSETQAKDPISDIEERPKKLASATTDPFQDDILRKREISDVEERPKRLVQLTPSSTQNNTDFRKEIRGVEERRQMLVATHPDQSPNGLSMNKEMSFDMKDQNFQINIKFNELPRLNNDNTQIIRIEDQYDPDNFPQIKERRKILVPTVLGEDGTIKTQKSDGMGPSSHLIDNERRNLDFKEKNFQRLRELTDYGASIADLRIENLENENNSVL